MAEVVWTVRASKTDLEALLKDIRQFEKQQGTARLSETISLGWFAIGFPA